ncbi:hypothetical protein ACFV0L_18455 [Streptosporangium canum]|uniref:hypothetical protein n=1 Tax=Streptosporangium canum TaxID=324952 RepID=UPI00369A5AB0
MTININGGPITVSCCGGDPAPALAVLHREDLYRLSAATVLPEQINGTIQMGQRFVAAKAILRAGKAITHLLVPVAVEALGVATGEARLAVYSSTGALLTMSPNDPKLFRGFSGWQSTPLVSPVLAEPEDRVVWLAALVPAYDERPPTLITVNDPVRAFHNLYNTHGLRTFTLFDRTELPSDIGGDSPSMDTVPCIVGADLSV